MKNKVIPEKIYWVKWSTLYSPKLLGSLSKVMGVSLIFGDKIGYHSSLIPEFLLHETTPLALLLVIYC